jgi:hypothetical protein
MISGINFIISIVVIILVVAFIVWFIRSINEMKNTLLRIEMKLNGRGLSPGGGDYHGRLG